MESVGILHCGSLNSEDEGQTAFGLAHLLADLMPVHLIAFGDDVLSTGGVHWIHQYRGGHKVSEHLAEENGRSVLELHLIADFPVMQTGNSADKLTEADRVVSTIAGFNGGAWIHRFVAIGDVPAPTILRTAGYPFVTVPIPILTRIVSHAKDPFHQRVVEDVMAGDGIIGFPGEGSSIEFAYRGIGARLHILPCDRLMIRGSRQAPECQQALNQIQTILAKLLREPTAA